MTEQWQRCEQKELTKTYHVQSIHALTDSLKILLAEIWEDKEKVLMNFQQVYSYRVAEEGLRLHLLPFLEHAYGKDFYDNCTFFKIINSSYLKQAVEESGTHDAQWIHFVIFSANLIVMETFGYQLGQ